MFCFRFTIKKRLRLIESRNRSKNFTMSQNKRQVQSGAEIESSLTEKMNWIVSGEGSPSEFLDDYFLSGDVNLGLPALAALQSGNGQKRKLPLRRDDGRAARREGSGITMQQANSLTPPITNRGVSKYQAQTENSTVPLPILGGYDGGIEVGFEGTWDTKKFSSLLVQLETAKLQASEQSQQVCVTCESLQYVDCSRFP
jgi:hypothetical protein